MDWNRNVRKLSAAAAVAACVAAAPVASAALIGEWNFDAQDLTETSGFKAPGTHDGQAVGSVVFTTDTPLDSGGYAIDLNGGDNAVRVLNSNEQNLGSGGTGGGANATYQATYDSDIAGGPMTISVWAKGWPGEWEGWVTQKGESGNGYQLRKHGNSDNATFTTRGTAGPDDPQGGINANDGQWHHYVGVWDSAAGNRYVYVDGVLDTAGSILDGSDTGSVAPATWEFLVFGARDNGGSINSFSNGLIDDVQIHNSALTQAQIAAVADRNLTAAEKIADSLGGAGSATGIRANGHTSGSGAINNIDEGEGLLSGALRVPDGGSAFAGSVSTINFSSGPGTLIGGDTNFPNGSGDNMATGYSGVLDIQSAGQYVFGVNSDDGFRLTIGGKLVSEFIGATGSSDERVGVTFDEAGLYRFELTHFNGGGGNHLELWAKQGADATVGPLVGDTGAGGIAVYQQVLTSTEKIGDAITPGTGVQTVSAHYAQRDGFDVNSLHQAGELLNGDVEPTRTIDRAHGAIAGIGVPNTFGADHFGGQFTGVLNITAAGEYRFDVASDDGFRLEIGGVLVSTANYPKPDTTVTNFANFLEAGVYAFTLDWFEKSGGEAITFNAVDTATQTAVELYGLAGDEDTIRRRVEGFTVVQAALAGGALGGSIDNVDEARMLFADSALQSAFSTTRTGVLNFLDGGDDQHYGDSLTPLINGDQYAMLATASLEITEAGFYTFGINSDDGAALAIGGNVLLERFGTTGPSDSLATIFFAEAGWYDLELLWFENSGGASLELFAAMGAFTSWNDADFRLVGDTANGGLRVMTIPTPAALPAGLALVGLAAVRRKRRH